MNQFVLRLGDLSDDGHGITEDIVLMTNLLQPELMKCYGKGVELIGFDLIAWACIEYEQSWFTDEQNDLLNAAQIPTFEDGLDEWDNMVGLDPETYVNVFCEFVKRGAQFYGIPATLQIVEPDVIEIGGYGLYT